MKKLLDDYSYYKWTSTDMFFFSLIFFIIGILMGVLYLKVMVYS